MTPKIRVHTGPEKIIQDSIVAFMEKRDWYVKVIHSSTYMPGMPDLYCVHRMFGDRWIEVKDPHRKGDVFTAAQHKNFPLMHAHGAKIYVWTAADEASYKLLFGPPNWWTHLQVWKG